MHWGDNRQNPPQAIWDQIGDIDVAILPIDDGGHILSAAWADRVREKMHANIVIPSHYYIERLNNPYWFFNKSADEWALFGVETVIIGLNHGDPQNDNGYISSYTKFIHRVKGVSP